ncbi:MAG: hypothetical protein A4S09_04190 [Proteobacteria bacterium SG_bin7]|nr:MAG: hypothetical protein A4S09_04190 [Proteobacteria bacterium SG_bin7]
MSKWYYLLKGKAQGPVTENQIRELLREHQLTLNDIVFREGENKWKRISEFADANFVQEAVGETNLQQLIKLPTKNDPEKWVVLLKIQTETEIKFVQKGSWTTTEVKNAIQRGEVSYSDHIWKSGFTKWERIGDLDEFSFKGETQIFSMPSSKSAGKLKLTEDILKPRKEAASTATRAALKENPIPDEVPEEKKPTDSESTEIVKGDETNEKVDFSEKTSMAFSLKLDKARISDLINKASREAEEKTQNKFDDRTVLATEPQISEKDEKTQPLAAVRIPDIRESESLKVLGNSTSSIPKMAGATGSVPHFHKASNLVFDDENENRKESSLWLATNKTRSQVMTSKGKSGSRRRKKKFWNTVFQFTQIILVVVIISLVFATLQNLKKRNRKTESPISKNLGPNPAEIPQAKKRGTASDDAKLASPAKPAETKEVTTEVASIPILESPETEVLDAPNIIEEFIDLASKPSEDEKKFPPIKPRTTTPFVKIKPVELNGKSPKLRFSSNANEGEVIKFSIRGMTGEILDKPSFKIERTVKRRRGKDPEVNLRDLGVTAGYFTIEAELAGAKSILDHIFVGSKKNFEGQVRNYRKEVAYRQQWEKKTLVRIASDISDLTKEIFEKYMELDSSKEWQEFFSDWRRRVKGADSGEMRSISLRNQNEYAYPDVWIDLRSLRQRIVSEAEEMNSAFLASRRTASSPNRKLLEEANNLANRAGDLSGWRQKSAK